MRKWVSGFSIGFTVMGMVALWYRSQLREMQERQAASDAFNEQMIADMEAEWDEVPTDRKLRIYMKMAEDGIPLTDEEENETEEQKKKKRRNNKK